MSISNESSIDNFNSKFMKQYHQIEKQLKDFELSDLNTQKLILNQLNENFNNLKQQLDFEGSILPQYIKKVSQEKVNYLNEQINKLKKSLIPEKKFVFKKANVQSIKIENKIENKIKKEISEEFIYFGFENKVNENLILNDYEVKKKDVRLSNLVNCELKIYGNPSTVHIVNCKNCKINIGPVSTSIFVTGCADNTYQLFCQQLRIHETKNCIFYLHVTTKGIIEDSKDLKFGIFNWFYENIKEHINQSNLNEKINNFDQIQDFNWLIENKKSPNWSLIEENVI